MGITKERIMNEKLWEKLLDQIHTDLNVTGDYTALYELLCLLPDNALNSYLAEDELGGQDDI